MANKRKDDKGRRLTPKQMAFLEHYTLHHNAAAAYRHAYPTSQKWTNLRVASEASTLLGHPIISAIVAERHKKTTEIAEKKFEVTISRVLHELALIAFQNSDEYFTWGTYERQVRRKDKQSGQWEDVLDKDGKPVIEHVPYARIKPSDELTRQQKAALLSVSETISRTGDRLIEAKMADKLGALKLLGQHLGMFKERVEHKHEHTVIENAARDLDGRLADIFARTAEVGDSPRAH